MAPGRHSVTRRGEVLPDRANALDIRLRATCIAKAAHVSFAPAIRLMAAISGCQGVESPAYLGLSMGDIFNAFHECARRMTASSGTPTNSFLAYSKTRRRALAQRRRIKRAVCPGA
jgi:hypothetical protein